MVRAIAAGVMVIIPSAISWAGDWPQILGPQRNGIAAADEKLADHWRAGGPPVLWERSVGSGVAGVAVVGERGILFHRYGGEEVIEAFNVADGQTQWRHSHSTSFTPRVGREAGPLCVPTVAADRVITFGPQGILTCNDLTTGEQLWQRNAHREYQADEGYFGAGSSPLVIGDRVVVNVGGSRSGAGIVAFSLQSGETLWKQTDEPPSYSAPIAVTVQDVSMVLMVTRYKCLLFDPQTGAIVFQFPFGQRGPTVNAASPLVTDGRLFVTSSYGIGCVYADFDLSGFRTVWNKESYLATQVLYAHSVGRAFVRDRRPRRSAAGGFEMSSTPQEPVAERVAQPRSGAAAIPCQMGRTELRIRNAAGR